MGTEKGIFQRTALLLGSNFIELAAQKRVLIFGIGGVGSWCAESLIRSGIRQLTIVDSDRVCITNINRQLMATTKTVGKVKTEVLKERLLEINPKAQISAIQKIYCAENSDSFELYSYDFIIDSIDSLANKIHLIQTATKTNAVFFSSMGAALKMDPTRIKVTEFWKVDGCPLGAALRKKIRKMGGVSKKFMCVYSDEHLQNVGFNESCGTEKCLCPKTNDGPGIPDLVNHEWCSLKAQVNGTTSYMPAMFGMTIASLVVQAIEKESSSLKQCAAKEAEL
ncbi:MAG: tRNA threonylcarbamoyladenosine dehydratase [Porphyromonadaceae bacterium CG2_30_38_12]|nr:MAG: tRNA threonylcarbamoyladenosine dehydratase [Porphyromonadaceae bacterium CG2_30_38_12]